MDRKTLDPLEDGKSSVELLDYMGGDLAVANDARASFDRAELELTERGIGLINYLLENEHMSPLRGTALKFRVRAPLFLARQFFKHVVASTHIDDQLGWNEQSLRYTEISDDGDFYLPKIFRAQASSNRQSSDSAIFAQADATALYAIACRQSFASYEGLLALGTCREQARGILVPGIYVTWVWTTSLQALLNFLSLRKGEGAQSEIQRYALAIEQLSKPVAPWAFAAYEKHQGKN